MKSYNKQQIVYKLKDFFRENKWLIATCACFCLSGFALGLIIYKPVEDLDFKTGVGGAFVWCLITLILPYFLTLLPIIGKYCVVLIPVGFIYLGIRFGKGADYLYAAAGLKGLFSCLAVYLPIITFSFLLICLNTAFSIISIATTCPKRIKTIFARVLVLFSINLLFILVYLLIFGNVFNVIIIDF